MIASAKVQSSLNLIKRSTVSSNLQKTQDVIDAQGVRLAHLAAYAPSWGQNCKDFVRNLNIFTISPKPFSHFCCLIARPTHDRLTTLRQVSRTFPARGSWEAGRPGPPPFYFTNFFFAEISQHPAASNPVERSAWRRFVHATEIMAGADAYYNDADFNSFVSQERPVPSHGRTHPRSWRCRLYRKRSRGAAAGPRLRTGRL